MRFLCLWLIGFSPALYALPTQLEVWFLSHKNSSFLEKYFDKMKFSKKLAQGADCIPMGDGCFHPQLGFVKDSHKDGPAQASGKAPTFKTFNMQEVELVECDKKYYFDVFCGEAKKEVIEKSVETEIWIDISGSFRLMDYSADPNHCKRRGFVELIKKKCADKVGFKIFHTDLFTLQEDSLSCLSNGGNNQKKMLKWIAESQAKKLIIVTDIDEYSKALDEFLSKAGAKILGAGVVPLYIDDLNKLSAGLIKSCKI